MPFETPIPTWTGDITAYVHEHGVPPGAPPSTIIRTDQSWSVHIKWHTDGIPNGMIHGFWHLHCFLESLGPGNDEDLIDPPDHLIPLTPSPVPVINYSAHFDVPAGRIGPVPPAGRLYRLVVSLTYRELGPGGTVGPPGPIAAFDEGPVLQFYQP